MISENSAVWMGRYPELFADEIDRYYEYDGHPIKHIDCDSMKRDSNEVEEQLTSISTLFAPNKVFRIDNADSWKAAEVQSLLNQIVKSDIEYDLCLTWNSGKTIKALTVVPNIFDFTIENPFDWMIEFSDDKRRKVSEETADSLIDFCGDDERLLVSAFRSAVASTPDGEEITWEFLRMHLSEFGQVASIEILKSIQSGDPSLTAEVGKRVLLGTGAKDGEGFKALAMLTTVFRNSLVCGSLKERDAIEVGAAKNGWGYKNSRKLIERIGDRRAEKCMEIILDASRAIRGGSRMKTNQMVFNTTIRLSQVCAV